MAKSIKKEDINNISGGRAFDRGFHMVPDAAVIPGVVDGMLEFTDDDMVRRFAEFRSNRYGGSANAIEDSIINDSYNRRVELNPGELQEFLDYLDLGNNRNRNRNI